MNIAVFDNLFAWMARIYVATNSSPFRNVHGSWRIRKIIKNHVLKDRYLKTAYLGHVIYACPTHSIGGQIFEGNLYEPTIIKAIQAFVAEGFSFIDIGANIGLHTLAAAFARTSDRQVFVSFEPQSEIFSVLEKNCIINPLPFVSCRQEGVGDADTLLSLNESLTNNKGKSSFLPRENTKPMAPIKVSRLDTLFLDDENLISKAILLKIDTEGYELPIIKGGMKWLSKVENAAIICEISTRLMEQNGMVTGDLFAALEECGFMHHKVFSGEDELTHPDAFAEQYNAIFYKGSMAEKVFSTIESEI